MLSVLLDVMQLSLWLIALGVVKVKRRLLV